jgi:hypothetical protein
MAASHCGIAKGASSPHHHNQLAKDMKKAAGFEARRPCRIESRALEC